MQQTTDEQKNPLPKYPILDVLYYGMYGYVTNYIGGTFPSTNDEIEEAWGKLTQALDAHVPDFTAQNEISDRVSDYVLAVERLSFYKGMRIAFYLSDDLERLRRDMGHT